MEWLAMPALHPAGHGGLSGALLQQAAAAVAADRRQEGFVGALLKMHLLWPTWLHRKVR